MTSAQPSTPSNAYQAQQASFSSSNFLLFIQAVQYLCLAGLIFCGIATFILPDRYETFVIYDAALLAAVVFFLLLGNLFTNIAKVERTNIPRKARLYRNMLIQPDDATEDLVEARVKALEYCQELIDDYKRVRRTSKRYYYIFQLGTIILSSLTPILVLLDKQVDVPYIKWLPIIFPAIAAIISSISTSFPFQENWVNANKAVEQLEAEQEEFTLGVTESYRAFTMGKDSPRRRKKLKLAVENFIVEVNRIHLQQVSALAAQTEEQEPDVEEPDDDSWGQGYGSDQDYSSGKDTGKDKYDEGPSGRER